MSAPDDQRPVPSVGPRRRVATVRGRRRTGAVDRTLVWALVAAGAVVGVVGPGAPTGSVAVDVVWRALFGATVALAASRARRWAWIAAPAVLTVASEPWLAVGVGAVAVAAGVLSVRLHRRRAVGAAIGVVCVGLALHLPDLGGLGGSAAVAAVGVAPLLVSGYRATPVRPRRWVRWSVAAVAAVIVVGTVVAVTALMVAWRDVTDAESAARDGLEAAEGGDTGDAAEDLAAAADGFGSAAGALDAWWARPARLVPVVAQHAEAVTVAAQQGGSVTRAASASAAAIELDELRYRSGRVDLDLLAAAAPALADTATSVGSARQALDDVGSVWLAAPLQDRIDQLADELADVAPDAELAALAAERLPVVLGAEGPKRYLVAFTTPAESRGVGGFVGSWAVLEADDGRLDLVEQGRAADVNERPGRDVRTVTRPSDYVGRYARFRPGYWFQDTTLSPDVPSSALAVADVFAQAGYAPVDGVIFVDPYGLAALLRLTGPVDVPGRDRRLGPDDAADWLLRGQYLETLDQDERADLLGDVGSAVFDELVATDLPGPRRLGEVLGPPVAEGHLSVVLFDEGGAALADRLGTTRPFPAPDGADLAGLVTQNNANNKIDVFLRRTVDYRAEVDPATGQVEATATVSLANDAPATGLPPAVIGSNDRDLPPGTNRLYLSWYSALRLEGATVDGVPATLERQRELGWYVYSTFVEVPPGGSVVVDLELAGFVDPGSPYRLHLPVQPLVAPDTWTVAVDGPPGVTVDPAEVRLDPVTGSTLRFGLDDRR